MTGKTTSIVRGCPLPARPINALPLLVSGGFGGSTNLRRVFEDRERFLSFEQRNVVEMPATLLVNRHRHDLKSITVQMSDYGRSRLK